MIKITWILICCLLASNSLQNPLPQSNSNKDIKSTTITTTTTVSGSSNNNPSLVQADILVKRSPTNRYRHAYGEYSEMDLQTLLNRWDELPYPNESINHTRGRRAAILDAIIKQVPYRPNELDSYIEEIHSLLGEARVRNQSNAVACAIRRGVSQIDADQLTRVFAKNRKVKKSLCVLISRVT